jgi:hypothetical protein
MMSRKAAVVVAAGAAAAIAIPSAFAAAAPTYKITAGSHKTGSTTYTSKTTGASPQIHFTDNTSNQKLTCKNGTASGSVKLGAKVAAAKAGTIGKTSFVGCTGPQNLSLTVKQVGTWSLNGSGKVASGKAPVYIGNVKANVSGGNGLCKFTVTGAVNATYSNSAGTLAVKSTAAHKLTISSANCLGIVNKGDVVSYTGTYKITAKDGKLAINNS